MVLGAGADVNAVDNAGNNPLHCLICGEHGELAEKLTLLLALPQLDIHAKNYAGKSATDLARDENAIAAADMIFAEVP